MANILFDTGRQAFLDGEISWSTSGIKAVLIETGTYTFNAAHATLDDVIDAGAVVASTTGLFTGKTSTAGIADADDPVFPSVAAGDPCDQIVIYQSTAFGDGGGDDVPADEQLVIGRIDTAVNLPITPSGIDIKVVFSDGTNRIFKL